MPTHHLTLSSFTFTSPQVICALAPRELKESKEFTDTLQQKFAGAMYPSPPSPRSPPPPHLHLSPIHPPTPLSSFTSLTPDRRYTHHQKSVVCDAPDPAAMDGRRKLIAYVGGLDLTGGRWDNFENS